MNTAEHFAKVAVQFRRCAFACDELSRLSGRAAKIMAVFPSQAEREAKHAEVKQITEAVERSKRIMESATEAAAEMLRAQQKG